MKAGVIYDEGRFLLASRGGDVIAEAQYGDVASHRALLARLDDLHKQGLALNSWMEPHLRATVAAGASAFQVQTKRMRVPGWSGGTAEIEVQYVVNVAVRFDGDHAHEIGRVWLSGDTPWNVNFVQYAHP